MSDQPQQSPLEVLNPDDPGDDTQRRFRYQHAYGVIIGVAIATGGLKYRELWCEHHDDYLVKCDNGNFEAFQIKTRKPEIGAWECLSDAFVHSIGRFVELDDKFPQMIGKFHFVSNAEFFKTAAAEQLKKSPILLKRAVDAANLLSDLADPFLTVAKSIAAKIQTSPEKVFSVLKRLELVPGPSLDDFDAVVAHEHIGQVPQCSSCTPSQLNALRDELIHLIYRASSLAINDGSRHWIGITAPDANRPLLLAKRVSIDDVKRIIANIGKVPFRFAPAPDRLRLGNAEHSMDVMEKKLIKGGLAGYTETMRRRALSAEMHLLELSYQRPDEIETIVNQLDGVVRGAADDAKLEATFDGPEFGEKMLFLLSKQLRLKSEKQTQMVCSQDYECLMGLTGLLTSECKIWWSEKFDVSQPL